jgi:hypothetical protein
MSVKKKSEIFKIGDLVKFPVYDNAGNKTYEIGVIISFADFQNINNKKFYKIYTGKNIANSNFRIFHKSALLLI